MIVGIDPGQSGAVIIMRWDGMAREILSAKKCTLYDIAEVLTRYKPYVKFAYIETVGVRPEQGISSAGKFMTGFGEYKGLMAGIGIPVKYVLPQVWQRSMKCLTKGDKNITKRKAQELFPSLPITHQIADALLIAEYGRRQELLLAGSKDPAADL